jgi:hypothetical protein
MLDYVLILLILASLNFSQILFPLYRKMLEGTTAVV